jgi:shikimate kinase
MVIYLVGFMGSGKTHIGKLLAKRIGYDFVDMDEYFEMNQAQSVATFFELSGESRFRELEKEYLLHSADWENTVVATGGGCPCFFDNMSWMNDKGITIYLKLEPKDLFERLVSGSSKRPLLQNKTRDGLKSFIEEKLNERSPFYNQAKLTINNGQNAKKSIDAIARSI